VYWEGHNKNQTTKKYEDEDDDKTYVSHIYLGMTILFKSNRECVLCQCKS
jgi:hypothetical protein